MGCWTPVGVVLPGIVETVAFPTTHNVVFQPACQVGGLLPILPDCHGQKPLGFLDIGCVEDGADVTSYIISHALLRHVSLSVLPQMELAPLPWNTAKDGATGSAQTGVGVAGDQLHPSEPPIRQALQKSSPVGFRLAEGDRYAEHFSLSLHVYTNGRQHGGVACLAILP